MSLRKVLGFTQEPVWLMDGTAFVYRAFYAQRSLQRSDGFPTNAIAIVGRILLRILRQEQPKHFCFMLDGHGKNFRHELFPIYKAQRSQVPDALIKQLEPIQRLVTALGFHYEVSSACEADDCIASLANKFKTEGQPVVILGSDKDFRQCLAPSVYLWDPAKKESEYWSEKKFMEAQGFAPQYWPDLQAIIGDSADNIPGVPGVGIKTAERIFESWSSLEAIRDNFSQLPDKLQTKFEPHLETMFMYRELTRLRTDCCSTITLEDLAVKDLAIDTAGQLLREFELTALMRELDSMLSMGTITAQPNTSSTPVKAGSRAVQAEQMSLFGSYEKQHSTVCHSVRDLPECADVVCAVVPLIAVASKGESSSSLNGYTICVDEQEYMYQGSGADLVAYLAPASQIVLPDVKSLWHMESTWQKLPITQLFDLGLAAYLLDPEARDYAWARLSAVYGDMVQVSPDNPALLAANLASYLSGKMAANQLMFLYQKIEMPLLPVLFSMEQAGITLNLPAFTVFLEQVQAELADLTEQIYEAAGGPFNIRSSQQLAELLYTTLKLPTKTKTKGGQLSTAQDVLEELSGDHPIVDAVLRFRTLEKLRSTYLEPLPRLVDNQSRLHTTLNQKSTATGRLSSSEPNLQNIPVKGQFGKRMRQCFTASETTNTVLVAADYSQVELRVLAHMSQDKALVEAFQQGVDIHSRTASLLYDVELDQVSAEQRGAAKTINFGLVYGMGPQKLGHDLKISVTEAKEFIQRYFSRLTGLKDFYAQAEDLAKQQGFVTTMIGRRRLVPDINSHDPRLQAQARRQALNTLIQGSAADIIKLAMLAVFEDAQLKALGATLILQIHDELLVEVAADKAQQAGERMAELMENVQNIQKNAKPMLVPLKVDWGIGKNWGEAH